ncbi:hemerythrin domain-containing protein [Streptomyces sp. AK02-01A]|uniref:hemerythrin domain-containing protein n=1 Tax=Streptomyces sp. AK02-01A TaxID=3028648 RepID=UPI0029AD55C0|nr:hemerythrin domain-containing protein [Streptomyces sp. AK02-01A]MDX3853449.1 hemerythrin domain-containing protein [Streptomyces sp. AK02-01A]
MTDLDSPRDPAPAAAVSAPPGGDGGLWPDGSLDEATRPRAPRTSADETAPSAPYPGGTGARLIRIHAGLRQEMAQIQDAVAQIAIGASDPAAARSLINSLTLRQNYWTLGSFCAAYCRTLTTHHTIEDQVMFPELEARQASLGPVVQRLEAEHEVIAEALTALDKALVALVRGDATIEDVQSRTDLLDRILISHLDYEEAELVGPLDRLGIHV